MKKLIFTLSLVMAFAGSALSQTLQGPSGKVFNIKDAYIGAGDSLHYLGTVDFGNYLGAPIDSLYMDISTEDSCTYTIYARAVPFYGALTSDTVAWNATGDAYPYIVAHVGAQDTTLAWHNLVARAGVPKISGARKWRFDILIRASGSAMASRNKKGVAILRPYR